MSMQFLGLTVYYQHYVANYSQPARLLTDALQKSGPSKIVWDDTMVKAFQALKRVLTSKPVLATPNCSCIFILQCNDSDRRIGVVLRQPDARREGQPAFVHNHVQGSL